MQAILLNIRHGGGRRAQSILEWLARRSPDVIALPEWRNNAPGAVLKAGLESRGFQTATATTNGDNGVLFAAKSPFASSCVTPLDARLGRPFSAREGRGGALLIADFGDLRILSAYFPGGKLKAAFFQICTAQVEASTVPFVLIGDINTGRSDVDVEGTGTPFDCVAEFEALRLSIYGVRNTATRRRNGAGARRQAPSDGATAFGSTMLSRTRLFGRNFQTSDAFTIIRPAK